MGQRTYYFVQCGLWFCLAVLQAYHLHTGEVGWAWSTVLGLIVAALGACYYFGAGVRNAVRNRANRTNRTN